MQTKGAVVVITGASSGIGRATALELAKQGAKLVLVARREGALHGLAEECERLGAEALAVPTDVSIEHDVNAVVGKAINRFGKIDVWVNNAAVTAAGHFDEIPMEDFRRVVEINLFGYIYGARAIVPYFKRESRGIIINVASIVSISGEPYFAPYVISKFAIRGLSISLHQELQNDNISVCTVYPGVIDTPLYNQSANYMGKDVVAPGKAISAEKVSASIISLIKNPKRDTFVGGSGVLSQLAQTVAPELFDRAIEKRMFEKHFNQDKEIFASKGNLYDPMKEYASVSGGWDGNTEKEDQILKFAVPAALISGVAIGLALFFRNKRMKGTESKD